MTNLPSPIHPDLQPIAKMSPRFLFSPQFYWFTKWMVKLMPAPKIPGDILVTDRFIPGLDERNSIRLRMYQAKSNTTPVPGLIWLHGGGYVMGKPEMDDLRCALYAREAGLMVISVDYRYAPKHPFPTGLEESYAVLKWATAHAGELGLDAGRMAVGGGSAGGGLAAALAQLTHDRQEIKLALQLLVYPMLDDRTVLRTDLDDTHNVTWTRENNRFGWEAYLGKPCGAEEVPAYAVPARRQDLAGLPPAWIGVGSLDLFHDEDQTYARRLNESGVACEPKIVQGAFHGFDALGIKLPIVEDFQQAQIQALKKYLSSSLPNPGD